MSDDKAPNGLPWGPPGEVPDAEWVFVLPPRTTICFRWLAGVEPAQHARARDHLSEYRFAPVVDVATLQEQLAAAERRAIEAEQRMEEARQACTVPGVVRCAACGFRLERANISLADGNVGAGGNETEPCPNGCGPLWPGTWEREAHDAETAIGRLVDRAETAEQRAEEAEAACAAMRTAAEPVALTLEIPAHEGRLVNRDKAGPASALRAALSSHAGRLVLAAFADWGEVRNAIKQHLLGSDEDNWVDLIERAGRDQSALLAAIDARIEAEQHAEEAEAACAAMREALADPRWDNGDFAFCSASAALRQTALTSDTGRGWLPPEKAEELRRECDSYKAAAQIIGDSMRDAGTAVDVLQRERQAAERTRDDLARILAIVGTALGTGESEPLIDAVMRAADERDALRARVAELEAAAYRGRT